MSALDLRFAALSDPTRRAILRRLGAGEATVRDLAPLASISQPALSRHLKVLEQAGLIETRIDGTSRPRRLKPDALTEMEGWMATLRAVVEQNHARLDALLEELQSGQDPEKDP